MKMLKGWTLSFTTMWVGLVMLILWKQCVHKIPKNNQKYDMIGRQSDFILFIYFLIVSSEQ